MEALDLSGNAISDLRPLADLNRLQHLNLDSNLISDLRPLALFRMPELRELDLGANRISDLSPLSRATLRLKSLHLQDNAIADISPLLENIDLTGEVDLRHNPLSPVSVNEHIPALWQSEGRIWVEIQDDDHGDHAEKASSIAVGGFAQGSINPGDDRDFFRLEVASPVEAVIFASNYSNVAFRLFDAAGKLLTAPGSNQSRASHDIRRHLDQGTYFIQVEGGSSEYVLNVRDAESEEVAIADANLRAAVEAALDKAPGEAITAIEMARLAILRANDQGIASLAGLEQAAGLKRLELARNQVTDISPLAGLTNLSWALHLDANAIADISPLQGMVHLPELNLASNLIADLAPLAGLTAELESLRLDNNAISDLSPLAGLTALDLLGLNNNQIAEISPLAGLIHMETLELSDNQIADISSLARLTELESLYLDGNKVADPSALANLTYLQRLRLDGNLISDLTPLTGLTHLYELRLQSNAIADLAPLAMLSDLQILDLGSNRIADIAPLANLTLLTELRLGRNRIEDLSPLADLDGLCQLHLNNNRIMDVSPLAGLSRSGCLWIVSLEYNPLDHRSLDTTMHALNARGVAGTLEDDHGRALEDALALPVGGSRKGVISYRNDVDAFRLDLAEAMDLRLFTSGSLDTSGRLLDEEGNPIEGGYRPDGGHGSNFLFKTRLEPGTYRVEVTSDKRGGYILHAPDAKANAALVPLLLSAANTKAQGFVRVINHSAEAGTVRLYAREDDGWLHAPITLDIGARQTRHFNSQDLEAGNPAKGLAAGIGAGRSDWLLQFESDLDIEALAYARTKDGFLTAMHDVAPLTEFRGQRKHRVATFNPASNWRQVSSLRLINSARESASIEIDGLDDQGSSRSVGLNLRSDGAYQITAQRLEAGDDLFWPYRQGSFGDGTGKWRLDVSGLPGLRVMSLMESPT
ncbi:MAG: leucine-rich repeat domain-containing protein, partial [Rhodobacteraceae bacterium]|nr:leucine-rich repeat domain-containing protein [Paracoccaceae bacterium]